MMVHGFKECSVQRLNDFIKPLWTLPLHSIKVTLILIWSAHTLWLTWTYRQIRFNLNRAGCTKHPAFRFNRVSRTLWRVITNSSWWLNKRYSTYTNYTHFTVDLYVWHWRWIELVVVMCIVIIRFQKLWSGYTLWRIVGRTGGHIDK